MSDGNVNVAEFDCKCNQQSCVHNVKTGVALLYSGNSCCFCANVVMGTYILAAFYTFSAVGTALGSIFWSSWLSFFFYCVPVAALAVVGGYGLYCMNKTYIAALVVVAWLFVLEMVILWLATFIPGIPVLGPYFKNHSRLVWFFLASPAEIFLIPYAIVVTKFWRALNVVVVDRNGAEAAV
eukprot:527197_1